MADKMIPDDTPGEKFTVPTVCPTCRDVNGIVRSVEGYALWSCSKCRVSFGSSWWDLLRKTTF